MEPISSTLLTYIRQNPLFSGLDEATLTDLAREFRSLYLPSHTVLIREGEAGNSLYILLHGRLKVQRASRDGVQWVAEMGPGESVGEISLLVGLPRTATVVAIRDSTLVELDRAAFDRFSASYPKVALAIAKQCIRRLSTTTKKRKVANVKTVALIPLSQSPIIDTFVSDLKGELTHSYWLTGSDVAQHFDQPPESAQLVGWLNDLETRSEQLIYVADREPTEWSRLCLRQADLVCWLVEASDEPHLRPLEIIDREQGGAERHNVLFLLHPNRQQMPRDTLRWLTPRPNVPHYHLACDHHPDLKRATRIVTAAAVGLVLSGGGARGAAHAGLLTALAEAGVLVDAIGGSSMGAIIAALYSLQQDPESMRDVLPRVLREGSRLDWTYPYLSIARGERLVEALKRYAGEQTQIEDLWVPYYCNSTNLATGEQVIHRSGSLWRALRASASLPGIYPPVFCAQGLLVDGGTINNLPVQPMRDIFRVNRIIASQIAVSREVIQPQSERVTFSGWQMFWRKLSRFVTGDKIPTIADVLMRSMDIRDQDEQHAQAQQVDNLVTLDMSRFRLLDYDRVDRIIDEGYRQAKQFTARMDSMQ